MPPFVAAILAAIAANLGTDAARLALTTRDRLRMLGAPSVLPGRGGPPAVRQLPDPRVTLTAPVSWGPPVDLYGRPAPDGVALADRLARR